mmetsp:Transcript_1601/g.6418  ORF Transcript_1601/g.6418 Transcript_1601/m.6418 type:complete len:345 (+) Transcript_1601:670-1704(+)
MSVSPPLSTAGHASTTSSRRTRNMACSSNACPTRSAAGCSPDPTSRVSIARTCESSPSRPEDRRPGARRRSPALRTARSTTRNVKYRFRIRLGQRPTRSTQSCVWGLPSRAFRLRCVLMEACRPDTSRKNARSSRHRPSSSPSVPRKQFSSYTLDQMRCASGPLYPVKPSGFFRRSTYAREDDSGSASVHCARSCSPRGSSQPLRSLSWSGPPPRATRLSASTCAGDTPAATPLPSDAEATVFPWLQSGAPSAPAGWASPCNAGGSWSGGHSHTAQLSRMHVPSSCQRPQSRHRSTRKYRSACVVARSLSKGRKKSLVASSTVAASHSWQQSSIGPSGARVSHR